MNPDILRCVTVVAPPRTGYFKRFRISARENGFDPLIIRLPSWPGHYQKVITFAEWANGVAPAPEYVLFADGNDVIWQTGLEPVLEMFLASGRDIMFATEAGKWPDENAVYPEAPPNAHHRYLNAGLWIAKFRAAKRYLKDVLPKALEKPRSEQGIHVNAFLSGQHDMTLDYECRMAFCIKWEKLEKLGGRWTLSTGVTPAALHGAGGWPLENFLRR